MPPEADENLPQIVLFDEKQLDALAEIDKAAIIDAKILAARYPMLRVLLEAEETSEGEE